MHTPMLAAFMGQSEIAFAEPSSGSIDIPVYAINNVRKIGLRRIGSGKTGGTDRPKRTEIKRLHHATGTTIVHVTHDQIEAMTLATRIAVLKDGEVRQVGTPHEIYNCPSNLFGADLMGSPAMTLLDAEG